MGNDNAQSPIRFGAFELDLDGRELRKHGSRIKLPDQPLSILALLLERPGQVITREELQRQLWPSDTFVDFDRGLNKAVNRLRDALGDSADAPRFIETLPKRGYRFVGAVEKPRTDSLVRAAADTEQRASTHARRRFTNVWMIVAIAAGLALLAGALAMTQLHRQAPTQQIVRSSLLPPPNTSYLPNNFALSPDGVRLAFVAEAADGTRSLWVRTLTASEAQPVSGTAGASFPFWAPDNRRIGFFADRALKVVDIAGGAVRSIADTPRASGGTWGSKGVIVFAPDVNGPLYAIPAEGGAARPVTEIPAGRDREGHRWPYFLPDGAHFLYAVVVGARSSVFAGSLNSHARAAILPEAARNAAFASNALLYVRGTTLMAQPFDPVQLRTIGEGVPVADRELADQPPAVPSGFSASDSGLLTFQSSAEFSSHFVWFDASGRELRQLPATGYGDPALAPEGRRVAASCSDLRDGSVSICVYDVDRQIATRVTAGPRDRYPVWSFDGRSIAYGSTKGTYRVAADGSESPHPLSVRGIPTTWSKDGLIASFGTDVGNVGAPTTDVDRISLSVWSVSDQKGTSLGPGVEGQFSPDGKWIVHGTNQGIVVRPFPGQGPRVQISPPGSNQPRWSRDGKRIFYVTSDKRLMAVDFDPVAPTASAPRLLFQTRIVAASRDGFQYDVAPDGRFLINSLPSSAPPLTLITGWTAF
jgi:DNA-binding winged helix-turn-helix (wHTH) protein/Tol biopolymer transport system component